MLAKAVDESYHTLSGIGNVVGHGRNVRALNLSHDTQCKNGNNRTDRAKAGNTEGIASIVACNLGHRNTGTDRHDEGYGHRTCGNSARVEGEGQEALVNEECKSKGGGIKDDHNGGQAPAKDDTHNRNGKEDTNSHRDGENENHVLKAVYLLGKNNQIGLGDSN